MLNELGVEFQRRFSFSLSSDEMQREHKWCYEKRMYHDMCFGTGWWRICMTLSVWYVLLSKIIVIILYKITEQKFLPNNYHGHSDCPTIFVTWCGEPLQITGVNLFVLDPWQHLIGQRPQKWRVAVIKRYAQGSRPHFVLPYGCSFNDYLDYYTTFHGNYVTYGHYTPAVMEKQHFIFSCKTCILSPIIGRRYGGNIPPLDWYSKMRHKNHFQESQRDNSNFRFWVIKIQQ
jgi:hypothetical protein